MLELADRLFQLREKKAELKEEEKNLNEELAQAEKELAETMINEEVQNFTRNGRLFYLNQRVRISPKSNQKPEVYEWLKEHGYGDLVYETVNANSFNSFAKELMDQSEEGELPEELASMVNTFEETAVGMRKSK